MANTPSEKDTHDESQTALLDKKPKSVFVKTYGCQMNVYDSNRMVDSLQGDGYAQTDKMEEADLILLNTCHIREKASEKLYSDLGRIRQLKSRRAEDGKETQIGVAGCVAQAEGEEIQRRAPVVDLVVGPQNYHKLPDLVAKSGEGKQVTDVAFPLEDKFAHLPAPTRRQIKSRGASAFLTIQEGCDKFCSFCVVPYTRGSEVSRTVSELVEEARHMAEAGVREITLLGQNVNAWHGIDETGNEAGLGALLYKLAEIDGLDRLRYTTSHPNDMDEALIAAHRDLPELMPYLHLPVQAGSDKILKAMNRRHTRDDYLRIIDKIRAANPAIAMSGDFIVGYPGESDQDFEDTMDLIRKVGYASAYSFKYSPRPGTPAAEDKTQVEETVKSERLQALQALINQQQIEFNASFMDKTMDVLIERKGRNEGQLAGRSPWLQASQLEMPDENPEDWIGKIVSMRVTKVGSHSVYGVLA